MHTPKETQRPPHPERFRLRKVTWEDDYVDFLHNRARARDTGTCEAGAGRRS